MVLRWPDGWECEDVVAGVLEPALDTIRTLGQPFEVVDSRSALRAILLGHKRDAQIRMQIMDAAFDVQTCAERAARLVGDLANFASGQTPTSQTWRTKDGIEVLDPF